jgi:hypothetical protein
LATRRNPFPFLSNANRRCYRLTDRRPMVRMVRTFMHKHPRRERGLVSVMAIIAPIALFLMVALVPIHVASRASIAATGPLIVDGYVYSSTGVPVSGADVVVSIFDGTTHRWTEPPNTTDISGFYTVTVDPGQWDLGNTIVVGATKGTDVGENQTIADFEFQTIDVHFGTVIPELGGPAVTVLTVSAIGIMVVFCARRRGHESR